MDVNSVLFYIFMRVKSILSAFALMVPCMATIFTSCEKKDVTVAVTGIEVTPASVELKPGDTQVLTVSVLPENATDRTYTWSSSDESVATVTDDVVTAVADGSAVITAVTADGDHKASVIVKVATPYDGIVASSAGAVFMGDQYDIGYDEVFVYLLSGDVKYSDLSLSGKVLLFGLTLTCLVRERQFFLPIIIRHCSRMSRSRHILFRPVRSGRLGCYRLFCL